ncbi:tRNA modification GTPase MnmE [Candidatus Moranella endobia PCVAL]|uniref:tRNA modification GTPase MnmE n=1 Tax=Moranella endobia (strain PCIT) TaxID=903503 RepID=F7XX54_MOREP|nr:tRNA uridine-5-carboxymethylaminomethyl(34) synthesis GTPase MnmE [Candidatus Moranella endobia]AEI74680.1 tRNA modification GTPase TrmE [Candidatus Moranella endobia PCIT]AGJ61336.1 tRNA modification GTPase MnmE [Candidatus Moranella endobia PCVAL]
MKNNDTIAAIATPRGHGGIGIIRISGPLVTKVAYVILGKIPKKRQAEYLPFRNKDGLILDQGIALFFSSPDSFTGEDILELQGHGGPVILDLLLQQIISLSGLRIARPGEFLERAFLNNKLDLIQAEAIADLIDASSIQAARAAINSLQGIFSERINELVELLTNLRVDIESTIDFSEEKIDLFSKIKIESRINNLITRIDSIQNNANYGCLLREGMKVVIAGKPNAGKSSLLNALVGNDVAIVTPIAGTTRDVLREHIYFLDGMPLHITDTAGLGHSFDEVEKIGIERARFEIEKADHVLLIIDSTTTPTPIIDQYIYWSIIDCLPTNIPITIIRNKADITGEKICISEIKGYPIITISAKINLGVDFLLTYLHKIIGFTSSTEGIFLARRRHLDALETAAKYLGQCKLKLTNYYANEIELLAEDLRLAQQALSEITGEFSSDNLIKKIFSTFCIGK